MNVDRTAGSLPSNYGYLAGERLVVSSNNKSVNGHPPRKAVIRSQLPQHLQDNLSKIDPSNLPIGVKLYSVVEMTTEEKTALADDLVKLQKVREALRKQVTPIFSKILQISESQLIDSTDPIDLEKIKTSKESKCFCLDVNTMMNVILPAIQKHKPRAVDFSIFKNEIAEDAYVNFFEALPSLSIVGLRLSKDIKLTPREIEVSARIRESFKLSGRQFSIVAK